MGFDYYMANILLAMVIATAVVEIGILFGIRRRRK